MLAIQPTQTAPRKVTPNLLPCAINHNGPIQISERYWNPQQPSPSNESTDASKTQKEAPTSYFRGRKLLAQTLPLPSTHQGYVLTKTDTLLPLPQKAPSIPLPNLNPEDSDDDEDPLRRMNAAASVGDKQEEVKQLVPEAVFDEVMVWGHESGPGEDDAFVRGVEEWMGFAEVMHRV